MESMDELGSNCELLSPKIEVSSSEVPNEEELTEAILEDKSTPTLEERAKGKFALPRKRLRVKRRRMAQQTVPPLSELDPRRKLVQAQTVYYEKKTELLQLQTQLLKLQSQLLKRQISAHAMRNVNVIRVKIGVDKDNKTVLTKL